MSTTGVRIKRVEFSDNVRALQRTKKKLLLIASCPLKWVAVNRALDLILHDDWGEPIFFIFNSINQTQEGVED